MDYTEIMDMLMQELTQQAYRDLRSTNPNADALFARQTELAERADGIMKSLDADKKTALEEYRNSIIDGAGLQTEHCYLQGTKDCVLLLKKLGLL